MAATQDTQPPSLAQGEIRKKAILNFGLFGLFFTFYVGAAVIQTPQFKDLAATPALGMPLGLLLSLAIFPVSWVILAFWFWRAK